jgi:hypothetical protein
MTLTATQAAETVRTSRVARQSAFQVAIGAFQFDPLEEQQFDEPSHDTNAWIVQFHAPLAGADASRLRREFGLRLSDYVPERAYVERMPKRRADALRDDPLVRAVIPYPPEVKVSPTVGQDRQDDEPAPPLNAVLFDDADPASVRARLVELGAEDATLLDTRALGGWATIRFRLRSLDRVAAFAAVDAVRWIEPVPETVDDGVVRGASTSAGTAGLAAVWERGLHGEGQLIGIIDNGVLDLSHCFFKDTADNTPRPAHRKVVELRNAAMTPLRPHATFVAGCAAGDDVHSPGFATYRGGAWAAKLVAGNRKDIDASSTLLAELTAAAAAGATIHSNSWHSKPQGSGKPAIYDTRAAEVDAFAWFNEDHLILGSSGNSTPIPEEQGPPGTAKNAICVSAASANPDGPSLGDGNPGPTADGRRKPDLMTVGCNIESALAGTPCGVGPRGECASSYATPLAAAAAALVRQYFVEGWHPSGTRTPADGLCPSGALLKAVLLNAARRVSTALDHPNDAHGWGLVDLARGLAFEGSRRRLRIWDVRNADGLSTSESRTYSVAIESDAEPLEVTLVWTEPPGTAGARTPVINELTLEVIPPGAGRPHASEPDALNNAKGVLVERPAGGDWTITVRATAVNVGDPGQGFALVASGHLAKPPS